jgi:hypothetical protein
MKLSLIVLLLSFSAMANIPHGRYQVEKIQCTTGKVLHLGGKFMVYKIFLDVTEGNMRMTATANSGSWAPFKLNCTQVNEGTFTYTQEGKYEGDLPNTLVKCNAQAWIRIMKKKLFGVEKFGTFDYKITGNKLTISNPDTMTKYSCEKTGGYPIYHYKKIN